MSPHQLGVNPLLKDGGEVSTTTIRTERRSLIKLLLIIVMQYSPLGVDEKTVSPLLSVFKHNSHPSFVQGKCNLRYTTPGNVIS